MDKQAILKYKIEEFHKDSKALSQMIRTSDIKYDSFFAVMRGGLMPAMYIVQSLNSREIYFIGGKFHNDKANSFKFDYVPMGDVKGNVLIITDFLKSGKIVQKCIEYIDNKFENVSKIDIATIFYFKNSSILKPNYFVKDYEKELFIEFPWEEYSHVD